jgi:hypothetical protein
MIVLPILMALTTAVVPASSPKQCGVRVPGAEHVVGACLDDLTTAGTVASGHTDPADWAGLEPPGTVNPSGVPGIQLDGYFPDSSKTNPTHGWNHDSQFVIRLPRKWNGGLVVAGPPGVREQYANDRIIGDHALSRGFAFAATDKGNTGPFAYRDGVRPGDGILEWHRRMAQLTVATKAVAARHYGRPPDNPGLLGTLPPALRAYPRGARDEMAAAGYPAESEPLWAFHHRNQWDILQRILREEIDPGYDGATEAGTPFCPEGTGPGCDTDYDYADRPREVRDTVRRISLTGKIKRPLITIHGTLDALVPISRSSDVYARMTARTTAAEHRYYRIEGGNHVEALANTALVRPMLPCFRSAFDAMTGWVERGITPPTSRTVSRTEPCAL